MCSDSVQQRHTRSTGASNTRSKVSVRGATATLFLAGTALLPDLFAGQLRIVLGLQLAQVHFETIETLLPEAPVVLQPLVDRLERLRLDPARPPLRLAAARDQPGALQH